MPAESGRPVRMERSLTPKAAAAPPRQSRPRCPPKPRCRPGVGRFMPDAVLSGGLRRRRSQGVASRSEVVATNSARLPRRNAAHAHARVPRLRSPRTSISRPRRSSNAPPIRPCVATHCSGESARYPRCGRRAFASSRSARSSTHGLSRARWISSSAKAQAPAPSARFNRKRVAVSRRLLDQMREIGGTIAVSPEAASEFEHKFIDPWLAEHPLRDLTFVRDSPIASFADQSRTSGDTVPVRRHPGGTGDHPVPAGAHLHG